MKEKKTREFFYGFYLLVFFLIVVVLFSIFWERKKQKKQNDLIGYQEQNREINLNKNNLEENNPTGKENQDSLLGGDRDEHGCIASAGYSWCEKKQKCIRIWEEACASFDKEFLEDYLKLNLKKLAQADSAKKVEVLRVEILSDRQALLEFQQDEEKKTAQFDFNLVDNQIVPVNFKVVFSSSEKSFWEEENNSICRDTCGNGVCEEIVCMAEGCPCSETKETCPSDCH